MTTTVGGTSLSHVTASLQRSKDPMEVVAEAERQWIYSEDELLQSPSMAAGMPAEDERQMRCKGVNFIVQVGVMLKLPQTTISTAAVFFNRFLMRHSLVSTADHRALHHYQIAAVALYLATKVEEHSRKLRELVVACCRVAQKNPSLLVDEQTKDYWRWRDTILLNEDVLLESLCFDLTIESPYKILYELIRHYNISHNRQLRDTAWAFLNDSNMTQLCLLFPSRTIAAAALYCGARRASVAFPDDERGRPWWDTQHVTGSDLRRAYAHMAALHESNSLNNKSDADSIYVRGLTPQDFGATRQRNEGGGASLSSPERGGAGEWSGSEASFNRLRNGHHTSTNGHPRAGTADSDEPSAKRLKTDDSGASAENGGDEPQEEVEEGSEEGELEE